MKNILKYMKRLNRESGNSLAEFAVTTAMMATLATTAAPKFSGVGEGAKEKKTLSDIDKIITASNNFYNDQVSTDGRGRFPGQEKFNDTVPAAGEHDYDSDDQNTAEGLVKNWLALNFTDEQMQNYEWDGDYAKNFASVFGTTTTNAKGDLMIPDDHGLAVTEDVENYETWVNEPNYDDMKGVGALEYLDLFGGNPIASPFQDGHYIYLVIKGNGSGSESVSPILYVADLESPKDFWKKLQP